MLMGDFVPKSIKKNRHFGLPLRQFLTPKSIPMAFDIEMIKKVYAEMPAKVEAARKMLVRRWRLFRRQAGN